MDDLRLTAELRLLLLCARIGLSAPEQEAVRRLLADGIDWTEFARNAVDHGLACLAAHQLLRVAPEAVPEELLGAFQALVEEAGRKNRTLFDELVRLIDALRTEGIEAMPFKGPILAIEAYGDIALREFRDLDFLVRDADLAGAITVLGRLGYERTGGLTKAQFDLIHRLQGQEIIFGRTSGTPVEPHTKLTPLKIALDIDHGALWRRARRAEIAGRSLLTLAPEDTLLLLAIHGGKEVWWNLKWVCDIAAFIASHRRLDWSVVLTRARAQGCRRMVYLAVALAREYFAAPVPHEIAAAALADPAIEPMVSSIAEQWRSGELISPSNLSVSMDRLRLHDGLARRARYVARTVFLPGPQHIGAVRLPGRLEAYVAFKIAHNLVGLPLWRMYQQLLGQAERLQYAFAGSDLALAVIPGSAATRVKIRLHQKARAEAKRVLARKPDDPVAWRTLGDALIGLKRHEKAIACYDKALAFAPHNTMIWNRRQAAIRARGEIAGASSDPADPGDAEGWAIQAARLFSSRRIAEALEASDRALALEPGNVLAARTGIQARLCACDWRRRPADERRVADGIAAGELIVTPFYHNAISRAEAERLVVAREVGRGLMAPIEPLAPAEPYRHERIRIAYSSTDFRDHVVADMIVGCLEHHDKSRFEVTAISLGPNDDSRMRRRIKAAFDRFIDARSMDDMEVARTIRALEIDIVIDLNGISGDCRTRIFARRPAPVQAGYLGYPGTMGLPFYDYIIADQVVIPEENRAHYSEHVACLPHSFMPNDRTRPIASRTPSRAEAGLPDSGFVFACHNHEHKLGPDLFAVWMRLLKAVDGSVLWLKSLNALARINLRREASAHSVDPERLIFASHVARSEDHLARLRHAGLFLDTLPYNAHATACDALWAGVPVITCMGSTYPGRVAGSLLGAIGLPELRAASLAEYEALALALARDPEGLAALKAKLARNRDTEPLFDTERLTRDLESAYRTMWERHEAGQPPASFIAG